MKTEEKAFLCFSSNLFKADNFFEPMVFALGRFHCICCLYKKGAITIHFALNSRECLSEKALKRRCTLDRGSMFHLLKWNFLSIVYWTEQHQFVNGKNFE